MNTCKPSDKVKFADFMATIQDLPAPAGKNGSTSINPSQGGSPYTESPDPNRVCGDGERTEHLTRLAGTWIGRGYKLEDVIRLAQDWNFRNTPPLDDDKVERTCAGIHQTHLRNHGSVTLIQGDISPLFAALDYRAGRFVDKEPPPRRWLFEGVLPYGKVGMIVAPGGTGKSWALIQFGVSVVTGVPFAGLWEVGERGAVLMLLAEDDEDEIHRRLDVVVKHLAVSGEHEAIEAVREDLIVKSMVGENNQMTAAGLSRDVELTNYGDRLIATAIQIPNLKLIVIDPASRFRGGDENSAQDTTRFVEAIERVAQATGATILFAHHTNKGSMAASEASQTASRGSSALTDGVRWQMNLSVMDVKEAGKYSINADERYRYLTATITKNNYAAPQPKFFLKRGDGGYLEHLGLTSKKENREQDLKARIVALVVKEGVAGEAYSRTAFAEKFGGAHGPLAVGENAVTTALKELVASNHLSVNPKGKLVGPKHAKIVLATGSSPIP